MSNKTKIKQEKEKMKKLNVILVEVCHGYEEFHKAIGHVQQDEIYRDMPRCILMWIGLMYGIHSCTL